MLEFYNDADSIVAVRELLNRSDESMARFVWERALVAPGGEYYAVQRQITENKDGKVRLISAIHYLDASQRTIWADSVVEKSSYIYHLCKISRSNLITVTADADFEDPELFYITAAGGIHDLTQPGWLMIKGVEVSENGDFLAVNPRKLTGDSLQDYLVFFNLSDGSHWEYNFDKCIQCGRHPAKIKVSDHGETVVEFEKKKLTFSQDGRIILESG